MFRPLFRLLSRSGAGIRLFIFIFHRVLPERDALLPWEPDAARFNRISRFIAANFHVLPLVEAVTRLADGRLPAGAACITFDDGYADNRVVAAPILARHGLSATFFVASGYIDGGRMWNDSVIEAVRVLPAGEIDWSEFGLGRYRIDDASSRVRAYQSAIDRLKYRSITERRAVADELARMAGLSAVADLMMTSTQLIELRDLGMEIGGHTVSHPILAKLDERDAMAEIGEGRAHLTQWLGEAPQVFAYPNGQPGLDYDPVRDVALVQRAGYEAAVTTARGVARQTGDLFQLPRFTPWDQGMARFGLRCAETYLRC